MILAASGHDSPSIVQIRTQDVLPEALGNLLLRTLSTCREQLEAGAIVTVQGAKNRVRILPIP